MPVRPTEPTSALAALIAGNHRHVAQHEFATAPDASGTPDQPAINGFPRIPFALVIVEPGMVAVARRIFATGHDDVGVVDSVQDLALQAEPHAIKLIVAIEPIHAKLAHLGSAWQDAEHRAFATVESILRAVPHLRRAIASGAVRIVAALLEDTTERVHWIGEHPEIDLILRGA